MLSQPQYICGENIPVRMNNRFKYVMVKKYDEL